MGLFISKVNSDNHPTLRAYQFSGITLQSCEYQVNAYSDDLFDAYDIDWPCELKGAVDKRKAEFLCGRYLARHSLEKLGYVGYTVDIGMHRCLLYTSPSPRDKRQSRMPSSA